MSWFFSGLSDVEGCFTISLTRDKKNKVGWAVKLIFKIGLHKKDKALLEQIQSYLGVGGIYRDGNCFQYRVESIKDLPIVIKFCDEHPLITKKHADYFLLKLAINLVLNKEHLNMEGLKKIVAIKASMNKGQSSKLKDAFPNILPVERPLCIYFFFICMINLMAVFHFWSPDSLMGSERNHQYGLKQKKVKQVKILSKQISCQLGAGLRLYSTLATCLALNPYFVTGFTDAEGSFIVTIRKRPKSKLGWGIEAVYTIVLHLKDKAILELIQKYFGGRGNIYVGKDSVTYSVSSLKDLTWIIDHFEKYPLITQKKADFILWKQVIELMKNKEHFTLKGLRKIVTTKAAINLGLSSCGTELKLAFPNIVPLKKPLIVDQVINNPYWLAGFSSGEGCFLIGIYKSKTKLGEAVKLTFQITQHNRDEQLMKSLIGFFGCGRVATRSNAMAVDFIVTKFEDLTDKVIPIFKKYSVIGVKSKDFADWCQAADLIKNKAHLTAEGLDQIRKIKAGMNKGRK